MDKKQVLKRLNKILKSNEKVLKEQNNFNTSDHFKDSFMLGRVSAINRCIEVISEEF